jgi:phenylalanine-4-hydroxylase
MSVAELKSVDLSRGRVQIATPYLIEQDWNAYTPEQHAVWQELVERRMPQLREHACAEYLDGFEQIGLRADLLPNLRAVSSKLTPRTGWASTPVSGFLPADAFFEMLAARRFPTTTWLRARESMDYTPEPDIFHDVFGHVPMHAHPVFADFLEHYGKVCLALIDRPEALAVLVHGRVRRHSPERPAEGLRQRTDQLARRVLPRAGRRLRGA